MGTADASKRFRRHVLVTTVIVVSTVAFTLYQLWLGGGLSSISGGYTVHAIVPTSASLSPNSRVTMAGAKVGNVASVKLVGNGARVTMRIDDERVVPIPSDSRVAIRQRTPVGENYVAITPGRSSQPLEPDGMLPVTQADEYVDVDQILSLLKGKTRARAQQFIQGVGGALDGRGRELNGVLNSTSRILTEGGELTLSLVKSREQLSRLVDQFGDMTRAIGERGDSLRTLARQGRTAMQAVASRDDALRATLDQLPPTLSRLRRASKVVETTTGQAAPVFETLATAMRELQPAITQLQPASTAGSRALAELATASKPLQGTLRRLRELSRPAIDALPKFRRMLCETNPAVRYIGPYAPEIVNTMVGLGSATNSYDANGHLIRVAPLVSDNSFPGLPDEVSKALHTLRSSGFIGEMAGFGWDPYPPPGGVDDTKRGLGVIGPTEWKGRYPRIVADC